MDRLYFYRERECGEGVLQSMQWKSFTNATRTEVHELLKSLASGKYIKMSIFVPAYMVKEKGTSE